ncbi:MAG: nucleotide exchange factor GrpE [Bdellovibrionaceae bacterium]|nr:nucleotide exchange factor GrpE [Pseudobdellovibrionaceae bacterium]
MKDKKPTNSADHEAFDVIHDDEATEIHSPAPEAKKSSAKENAAQIDVDDLRSQLQKAANDQLYLRAEFDNFRKHSIRERAELLKYGGERLAKDLLETLDIFDTALSSEVTEENYKTFVDGIRLTAQQLKSTLEKYEIREVPSEGKAFDPTLHEALASEPTDATPPGHITKVFKKTYKYHDKILRNGQVVVARAKD